MKGERRGHREGERWGRLGQRETGTERGRKQETETEGVSGRDLAGDRRGSERCGQKEQERETGTEGERASGGDGN